MLVSNAAPCCKASRAQSADPSARRPSAFLVDEQRIACANVRQVVKFNLLWQLNLSAERWHMEDETVRNPCLHVLGSMIELDRDLRCRTQTTGSLVLLQ